MAQKAYQKFLSLKPPTLITNNNNDFDRLHNHTNFLLNNINNTCNSLVGNGSVGGGGGGSINHVKNDYSSIDDALSTISSTNSDYNNMDNNNYQQQNNSIDHHHHNGQTNVDYNDKNENFSYNVKISNSVKEMQKLESEQWNLLEKVI
jgi:hypothetical protein